MKYSLLLLPLLVFLPSCGGPERVDGEEFQKRYAHSGQVHTMRQVAYLGRKGDDVYLREQRMRLSSGAWKETVIYTRESDLDPAFRASLPNVQME